MKDLVINTAFCDMRSTREETLKSMPLLPSMPLKYW